MKLFRNVSSSIKEFVIADGFRYAGYSIATAFLSILITTRVSGGNIQMVGYVLAVYLIARSLAEVPLSRWTRTFALTLRIRVIGISYAFYALAILALGFSQVIWQIFVIQAVLGILDGFIYPMKWAMFAKLVDHGSEELEWSLEDISTSILPAICSALAGIISAIFGLQYAFMLFALLLALSAWIFLSIESKSQ